MAAIQSGALGNHSFFNIVYNSVQNIIPFATALEEGS
jgi:hypothetical protein